MGGDSELVITCIQCSFIVYIHVLFDAFLHLYILLMYWSVGTFTSSPYSVDAPLFT